MPNWTYNSVEVTGSVQDVQEFLDTVKATDSEGNDYFDFTQVNPIPSELQDVHTGAITIDEVRVDAWYEDDDNTRRPLLDITKDELTEKYGTYQPIDWQYNNWGTKWGDCETKLIDDVINKDGRELHFTFDSAWGEPFRLLNDIAIKFNVEVKNTWDIEMGQGQGVSEYPWTPEDTERIYSEFERDMNQMREDIRTKF